MSAALVVGEALVDIVHGAAHPGGSPLNVAIGLSRLGVPTTLHTRVGHDGHGLAIRRHLAASRVDVTASSMDGRPTSIAEAVIASDGAASYRFEIVADLADPGIALEDFALVHTGSIAAALDPGARRITEILVAARPHATISYDPNVRTPLMTDKDREKVARLVAMADVVKASDEDIAWLHPGASIHDVVSEWLRAGPAVVAVTRGAAGSLVASASGRIEVPAPPTEPVDTIGAGDSYMAAFLAALGVGGWLGASRRAALSEVSLADLERVARFAASCAAITVARRGADPPTREELPRA